MTEIVEIQLRTFFKAPGKKGLVVTPVARFLTTTAILCDPKHGPHLKQVVDNLGDMIGMVQSPMGKANGELVEAPAVLTEMTQEQIVEYVEAEARGDAEQIAEQKIQ